MRLLYVFFGLFLLVTTLLASYLFYKGSIEKIEVVDSLPKTTIILKDKKGLMGFLNEWQVFGGEVSYYDSLNKISVRGANIKKVRLLFTDVPQISGPAYASVNGENLLITDYSSIREGNNLLITIYLNENYLLESGAADPNIYVTQLIMGSLYAIFHPVGSLGPETVKEGLNEFVIRLGTENKVLFTLQAE